MSTRQSRLLKVDSSGNHVVDIAMDGLTPTRSVAAVGRLLGCIAIGA
jgi:hypothetical protein